MTSKSITTFTIVSAFVILFLACIFTASHDPVLTKDRYRILEKGKCNEKLYKLQYQVAGGTGTWHDLSESSSYDKIIQAKRDARRKWHKAKAPCPTPTPTRLYIGEYNNNNNIRWITPTPTFRLETPTPIPTP